MVDNSLHQFIQAKNSTTCTHIFFISSFSVSSSSFMFYFSHPFYHRVLIQGNVLDESLVSQHIKQQSQITAMSSLTRDWNCCRMTHLQRSGSAGIVQTPASGNLNWHRWKLTNGLQWSVSGMTEVYIKRQMRHTRYILSCLNNKAYPCLKGVAKL